MKTIRWKSLRRLIPLSLLLSLSQGGALAANPPDLRLDTGVANPALPDFFTASEAADRLPIPGAPAKLSRGKHKTVLAPVAPINYPSVPQQIIQKLR